MKIKQLLPTIAIVLVALFFGCKTDDFDEIIGVCPNVVSTSPTNNATEVPLDKVITATFNEKMNPLTINQSSFTIEGASVIASSSSAKMNSLTANQSSLSIQDASAIAGTVTYTDSTASFTPTSDLVINTVYTAKIKTSVKDTRGNALQKEYEWKFTTRNSPAPLITVTDPTNLTTNVAFDKNIQVTFNQDMTALTINASSFKLLLGTTEIPGEVIYYNKVATFNPTSNLITGTYTATITNDVESNTGVNMQKDTTWTFTTVNLSAPTVTTPDPANLATNVAFNTSIQATFNEAMTASTINASTFTIKLGTTVVPGVVSYLDKVATFNPTNDLVSGTYTATITNNVENGLGVKMVNDYVWIFTTVSLPPTVVFTDPVDGAINVAVNKTIKATFNEAMTASTINASNFTLKLGATVVPGAVSYLNKVATFTPTSLLVSGRTYTATVTNDVENSAGVNMLKDTVWTFTTGSAPAPTILSTDPADLAINVAVNKTIKATFNEAMTATTINSSNFTLKLGITVVPGVVSYLNKIASFAPTSNLVTGTYTATITNKVQNSAGVNMVDDYVWTFTTKTTEIIPVINIKSLSRFGILAGVGVSNNAGASIINNMDVGIYPGVRSSVTGFPSATINNGAIYASDDIAPPGVAAMLLQAKLDWDEVYGYLEGATNPAPATVEGDQGGKTLAPGIYKSTSTLLIQNGDLTLDAQGDVNAVWIFQVASDFTTVGGAGGNVILSGGAKAENVFWQVGSSATIGDYTAFQGNILALTSITMNSYSTIVGRLLAKNGSLVMTHTNIITKP